MQLEKIFDTIKALVAAAFVIASIWAYALPVDENTVYVLLDTIAAIVLAILGGNAALRLYRKEVLKKTKVDQ